MNAPANSGEYKKGFWRLLNERAILDIVVTLWRNLISCVSVMGAGIAIVGSDSGVVLAAAVFIELVAFVAALLSVQLARISYYAIESTVRIEVSKLGYALFITSLWVFVGCLSVAVYLIVERVVGGHGGYSFAIFPIALIFLIIATWISAKEKASSDRPEVQAATHVSMQQETPKSMADNNRLDKL
ncbi:hypothetical protein I5U54_15410 [Stenotrophomonas maltophilia]|nr:hypothetical protein [Stenotrophomonas maltophilia]